MSKTLTTSLCHHLIPSFKTPWRCHHDSWPLGHRLKTTGHAHCHRTTFETTIRPPCSNPCKKKRKEKKLNRKRTQTNQNPKNHRPRSQDTQAQTQALRDYNTDKIPNQNSAETHKRRHRDRNSQNTKPLRRPKRTLRSIIKNRNKKQKLGKQHRKL